MRLNTIGSKIRTAAVKRIGRGGKRGSYSGRGTKGQKSRAGRNIRPAERDLIIRLPKLRGFRNKPKSPKPAIINLGDIAMAAKTSADPKTPVIIDKNFLKKFGMISPRHAGKIKILSGGDIRLPVRVAGIAVSKSAKTKLEKAGGVVQ